MNSRTLPPLRKLSYASPTVDGRLTHYLFRFPAKFHPPVAAALLSAYSDEKDLVWDPFCGSGTLMVEACVANRRSIGSDVDPLATFVTRVKSRPLNPHALLESSQRLEVEVDRVDRGAATYQALQHDDISAEEFSRESRDLSIPAIPQLHHWFRRYVVVDLARLRDAILRCPIPETHRAFFLLCFAGIVRSASNADPVPVSGLEVTKHMRALDEAGRVVDPPGLFRKALRRALRDMKSFHFAAVAGAQVRVQRVDIASHDPRSLRKVDVVITSPPYHGAVDYYRRNQLEMYWLGLTATHDARLTLLDHYLGRPKPPRSHPYINEASLPKGTLSAIESRLRCQSPTRADAFKHYCVGMRMALQRVARFLDDGKRAVFVVGNNTWNGTKLNSAVIFRELARPDFVLTERRWYAIKNRYMSYARHNGASIDREYVLVFERAGA